MARDLNVRLRSGWFSERSACYLAAGRPSSPRTPGSAPSCRPARVCFAFRTADEAVAAIEAIEADYERHSRAAREIAEQYFRAELVLARLLGGPRACDASAARRERGRLRSLERGVNLGIVEAHERGIVTSASLMVRQPAAGGGSTRRAARLPRLDVGLHVDLGEWFFDDGRWHARVRAGRPRRR